MSPEKQKAPAILPEDPVFKRTRLQLSLMLSALALAGMALSFGLTYFYISGRANISQWIGIEVLIVIAVLMGVALGSYLAAGALLRPIQKNVQMLRNFAQDAGHELATPVSILQSKLQLMDREFSDKGIDVEQLSVLSRAVERMSSLVKDLRVLARSSNPHAQNHLSIMSMEQVVEAALSELSDEAAKKSVSFTVDKCDLAIVVGDREALHRCIINVVNNAIRYGKPNGTVRLTLSTDRQGVKLSIGDDGPGISAGDLPFIFDRFYRVDPSRSRKLGGSGLGLAIVRAIIEAHGGSVDAKSNEGHGTEVILRLPLSPARHPALQLFGTGGAD
jgi:signal transduction histidine kinase